VKITVPTPAELIYDRLVADEKLSRGTKYERLAALVYKVMHANADVVHHVILRGTGKRAVHEIDVAVDVGGDRRSMLIECRDRGRKVNEGEVRDFFGKLHQLNPDIGIVLSPAGFTRGAVAFADDEGIALAELRPVRDTDSWVETVRVEGHLYIPSHPTIDDIEWADDAEYERLAKALGPGTALRVDPWSDVYDADGARVGMLSEVMSDSMKNAKQPAFDEGRVDDNVKFPRPRTIKFNGVPARVAGLSFHFEIHKEIQVIEVKASGVAEMLLHHITGPDAGEGQVFFDEHFKALGFDDQGLVIKRSG
jgi:Restriction endonuclease